MHMPRKETFAEMVYRDIEQNEYLNEIYTNLLHNYSSKLFNVDVNDYEININHALRYADILSKSTLEPNAEKHRLWGQEIAVLLSILYPNDKSVEYYLGSVLSQLGNYRGLKSSIAKEFKSLDTFESIFYEYDKDTHSIPGKQDEYFFPDQKHIYDNLETEFFSYSGPTSMGKSFVVQTYIEEQIRKGVKRNYAILVPTKALINEVRDNIINALKEELNNKNYRIVSASEEQALKQDHHFVFVMTPERLSYMLINNPRIRIDFLFVDEAHKISERGTRSTYYYKVFSQIIRANNKTKVILASPNIPNPEVYLSIVPNSQKNKIKKLSSKYSPVSQFKYYLDLIERKWIAYNDYAKELIELDYDLDFKDLSDVVRRVGSASQNIVYCSSKNSTLHYAIRYAKDLKELDNEKLISLSRDIRQEVHNNCYLADLVLKGVAYHVGYLPAGIRRRIEDCFEDGDLRTIFCTSTLIEGVNLPADNLFVTSYRNGVPNLTEVEFRNLIGRVGRIKYNLYGNVFLVREDDSVLEKRYFELLENDVPDQTISIFQPESRKGIQYMVSDLENGDIELSTCRSKLKNKDYKALRNFSMILTRDIATNTDTPLINMLRTEGYLAENNEAKIKDRFPVSKTSDDITLSYDQYENLRDAIAGGLEYPKAKDTGFDYEEAVSFMIKLKRIFKWDIYEKDTIGKKGSKSEHSPLRWYTLLLLRWIEGNGTNRIIQNTLLFKARHPESGVQIDYNNVEYYKHDSKLHQNYVIANTLDDIERVILYKVSNYFRKFSIEFKKYHHLESFDNDWYEFVEYGNTNSISIYLQQCGLSREVANYILENEKKYVVIKDNEIRLKEAIFSCGKAGVREEINSIKYNLPELFVD